MARKVISELRKLTHRGKDLNYDIGSQHESLTSQLSHLFILSLLANSVSERLGAKICIFLLLIP